MLWNLHSLPLESLNFACKLFCSKAAPALVQPRTGHPWGQSCPVLTRGVTGHCGQTREHHGRDVPPLPHLRAPRVVPRGGRVCDLVRVCLTSTAALRVPDCVMARVSAARHCGQGEYRYIDAPQEGVLCVIV